MHLASTSRVSSHSSAPSGLLWVAVMSEQSQYCLVHAAVTVAAAPLAASAEEEGGYTKAPNGLEWKDVREGTGPSPVAGALIR